MCVCVCACVWREREDMGYGVGMVLFFYMRPIVREGRWSIASRQNEILTAPWHPFSSFFFFFFQDCSPLSFRWTPSFPVGDYISQSPLQLSVTMWLSSGQWGVCIHDVCNFWVCLSKETVALHFLLSDSSGNPRGKSTSDVDNKAVPLNLDHRPLDTYEQEINAHLVTVTEFWGLFVTAS